MHGIIFSELKRYVDTRYGVDTWRTLTKEAGVRNLYTAVTSYPDEELVALVSTASRLTGVPATELLEDYGSFLAPGLMKMYRAFFRPE